MEKERRNPFGNAASGVAAMPRVKAARSTAEAALRGLGRNPTALPDAPPGPGTLTESAGGRSGALPPDSSPLSRAFCARSARSSFGVKRRGRFLPWTAFSVTTSVASCDSVARFPMAVRAGLACFAGVCLVFVDRSIFFFNFFFFYKLFLLSVSSLALFSQPLSDPYSSSA